MTTAIILHPTESTLGRRLGYNIERLLNPLAIYARRVINRVHALMTPNKSSYGISRYLIGIEHDSYIFRLPIHKVPDLILDPSIISSFRSAQGRIEIELSMLGSSIEVFEQGMAELKLALEKLAIPEQALGHVYEDEAERNKKRFQKEQQKLRVRYSQRRR